MYGHDRFYNRVMKKRAVIPREDRPYASPKQFPNFHTIRQLYLRSWPDAWGERYEELAAVLEAHQAVDLDPTGFPEGGKRGPCPRSQSIGDGPPTRRQMPTSSAGVGQRRAATRSAAVQTASTASESSTPSS